MFEWASHVQSGRRTYPRVSFPLWQRGEHYLIMLTSGIGRVEAQGAFPWTWHTIFVLRSLGSPSGGRSPPSYRELRSAKYPASFFPLRRAGLKRCPDLSSLGQVRYQKKMIRLRRGLQMSSCYKLFVSNQLQIRKIHFDIDRKRIRHSHNSLFEKVISYLVIERLQRKRPYFAQALDRSIRPIEQHSRKSMILWTRRRAKTLHRQWRLIEDASVLLLPFINRPSVLQRGAGVVKRTGSIEFTQHVFPRSSFFSPGNR